MTTEALNKLTWGMPPISADDDDTELLGTLEGGTEVLDNVGAKNIEDECVIVERVLAYGVGAIVVDEVGIIGFKAGEIVDASIGTKGWVGIGSRDTMVEEDGTWLVDDEN